MQSATSTDHHRRCSMTEAAIVSVLAAFLVFVVILFAGWKSLRSAQRVCPRQRESRLWIWSLKPFIRQLAEKNGHPFATLTISATGISSEQFASKNDHIRNDHFIDAWGHELRYELNADDSFIIYSLGRDGKPGGVGLDADVFPDGREGELGWPTFMQFYFPGDPKEIDKRGLVSGAALTAMAILFAVFLSLRTSTKKFRGSLFSIEAITRVVGLVLLALAFGIILAPLHIPNGH